VSYIEPGCTEVTDEIKVEIYPELGNDNCTSLYMCNIGALTYDFDLTKNTTILMAGKINHHQRRLSMTWL
jgi:hypothetical protein